MGKTKKSIRDIKISGKRVLIRVDYNVAIDANGKIADDSKILATIPTIEHCLKSGASVILLSHLGRPEGKKVASLSLLPVGKHLAGLINAQLSFVPECVGERATKASAQLKPGQILLLENVRFEPGEEQNDDAFAQQLASLADVFVQDGFAVAYRKHASTTGITKHIRSVTGLLLEKELEWLSRAAKPREADRYVAIIGGDNLAGKIHLIERALKKADAVVFGGEVARMLLQGIGIRTSKVEVSHEDKVLVSHVLDLAREQRRERGVLIYLPQDAVVAEKAVSLTTTRIVDWGTQTVAEIEAYPRKPKRDALEMTESEAMFDIGPFSGAFIAGLVQFADIVLWCGVMGETSVKGRQGPTGPFSHGTELVAEALSGQFGLTPPKTIVAGDDTAEYVHNHGLVEAFDHISTGGGASLEVLAGRRLPGIEVLENDD